jgi:hypothetical protein
MSQDLLQDVDNMMRQEKLLGVWNRYGNYIVGGILALLVLVSLHQGYKAWFRHDATIKTAGLLAAGQVADPAQAYYKWATEHTGTTSVMARILAAEAFQRKGDHALAAAELLAARNDAQADKDMRDLATLLWVRLVAADLGQKPDDLQAALKPLMLNDTQPYYWLARLESAAIAAHRQNDPARAIDLLSPMVDQQALPQTLVERARAMMQVYRLEMPKPAAKQEAP